MSDLLARPIWDAFLALTGRYMPLMVGRDKVFLSADATDQLRATFRNEPGVASVILPDPVLHGIEMRLERRPR